MRVFLLLGCFLLAGWPLAAATPDAPPDQRSFDLPAGPAEFTLKSFSSQSGLEVVFATKAVAGIRTNAVKGRYRPIAAIELMLVSTALRATQDAPDRAIVISPNPEIRPGKSQSTTD